MAKKTIADHAADACDELGPLTLDVLTDEVVRRGGTKAKNPRKAVADAIEYDQKLVKLPGSRYVARQSLLRGRVLTHRLRAEELESGELRMQPDLTCLAIPFHTPVETTRGSVLRQPLVVLGERGALTGQKGWLDDCRPGDLLAFAADTEPLSITRVDQPPAATKDVSSLERLLRETLDLMGRYTDEDEPIVVPFQAAVFRLLSEDPDALTDVGLPLSELVGDLEIRYGLVGWAGTDWSTYEQDWSPDGDDSEVAELREAYRLTETQGDALGELIDAMDALADGALLTPAVHQSLAEFLRDPSVAAAWRGWSQLEGDPEAVQQLMSSVADLSTGATRARALHTAALAAEERLDAGTAEELIRAAVFADPADDEVRFTAARYASDRGDAGDALAHLRAAGIPSTDSEMMRLRSFAEAPPSEVGRNHPCPCGSGRKHKLCCLRDARHPLTARAPWLWQKLAQWAREPRQRLMVLSVAETLEPEGGFRALERCQADPMTMDLALWSSDAGLLRGFLRERASVLPEDERSLLDAWVAETLRLVEVVSSQPGVALRVRDLETDEEFTVRDKLGSRNVVAKQTLVTRLLPNGAGDHIASFVQDVPKVRRPQLAAAMRTSEEREQTLASWYVMATQPPRMTTRQGHELVTCTGTWQVPASAASSLAAELGEWDAGSLTWLEGQSIKASFTLEGSSLTASTLSRETWHEAVELVTRLVPEAKLLSSHSLAASDVLSGEVSPMRRSEPAPDTPKTRAILLEIMQTYEKQWVDDSIPALGGLTPRQALKDPARRRDVLDLIDGMDDLPGTMSSARVRELLGLTN